MMRFISNQIMTTIQTKLVVTATTTDTNINVNLSKLQQKKEISIGEGGSSPAIIKTTSIVDSKYKGKGVHVEPSAKEKKRLQELEMEKLRQLNRILMQMKDNPLGLNKGNPNKVWCCETIESSTFSEEDDFSVNPRKSYATETNEFN